MKIAKQQVILKKVDGTELDIVNAARVSFHKESDWAKNSDGEYYYNSDTGQVKLLTERDVKLIRYLANHNHWTPFGHVGATFVIKAPIFVARQLGKHQVGLVWNEVSRRYVDEEPEFFFPDEWRGRPVNAKQGSDGVIKNPILDDIVGGAVFKCCETYNALLENGVAPEQARMILPQNMMTEWWWTGSLAAFARVCKLRMDSHTQEETRGVAMSMYQQLLSHFPNSLPLLV